MRTRPSSKILVLNGVGHVLLFQFAYKYGPLAGKSYWAMPGGAVEQDETFEQAGMRELQEETGIKCGNLGPEVGQRRFVLQLADGEFVEAEEHYFVVRADALQFDNAKWTDLEEEVIADHKWWSADEIAATTETVWPENLVEMLKSVQDELHMDAMCVGAGLSVNGDVLYKPHRITGNC